MSANSISTPVQLAPTITATTPAGQTSHLDVEEELSFYFSYHANRINQVIHFFCIPQILWTWLIVAAHVALPGAKVYLLADYFAFQLNLALAFITSYNAYYILLDPIGGVTYLPISIIMYISATFLATSPPSSLPLTDPAAPSAIPLALVVHAGAWVAQFIGHGVFERRAPALFDNLVQALVLAPFFVHLEALFGIFDYKPDMHKKIKAKAGVKIRNMNRTRAASRAEKAEKANETSPLL
ncbi:endoplasmic reticulum protein [Cryptococcus wingfieldii CBS 7118]|uniref:Endoplasmic reticulum protein n=1 Tax=Cryptococcus wingfieldii CBS 7118 TaxID=1295528 RepID=A0A1E3K3D8_9TREE|nr:endoplasmic reticulum protein [Cryptococcus wingfieldii CBS 7118]ODO07546.1 endoplasmic reticulum protein [Cryptococcus wingfieldii CBS 7118]